MSLLICGLWVTELHGQTVAIQYYKEPLNEVLLDLNSRYGVQVSINAELSSSCLITLQGQFVSIEEVMERLAEPCGLQFSKINNVYSYIRKPQISDDSVNIQEYLFQGVVLEARSFEPIPFSSVGIGIQGAITDASGRFSYKTTRPEEIISVRCLGYQPVDTLVTSGSQLKILLSQTSIKLDSVIVVDENEAPLTNIGGHAGRVQFSNIDNQLVPGITNNLIFNNLRLYPGIMAAGESIADFVIWGSYAGQNHVIYDGITLFNSWGINDDIGRINPYLIKNVEVLKGGYNVPFGDRVGSVIMIDGKSGNLSKVEGGVSLTNQVASGHLSVPLFNNTTTLQLGGRKTYFDAMDWSAEQASDRPDPFIQAKYDYADFNAKLSTNLKQGDKLDISFMISDDQYEGELRAPQQRGVIEDISIQSEQLGGSIKYVRPWASGGHSSLTIAYSDYASVLRTNYFLDTNLPIGGRELRPKTWTNPISETTLKLEHAFSSTDKHQVTLSGAYVSNSTELTTTDRNRVIADLGEQLGRFSLFIYDQVQWTPKFSMQMGLKSDILLSNGQPYFQPRLNGRYDLTERWNVHLGWGLYNQFITKSTIIDNYRNRSDVWQVADDVNTPDVNSMHNVVGLGYAGNSFELSLEGYYKTTNDFSRYFINSDKDIRRFLGESNSIGLDLFLKKSVRKHDFWVSYSLNQVQEQFEGNRFEGEVRLAPQSQLHELKAAALLNFYPFQFSLTNVNGSGIASRPEEPIRPYWRMDAAAQYSFEAGPVLFETGVSILNVFNYENIRLNQSVNVPDGAIINTLGVPFTPTIFLSTSF